MFDWQGKVAVITGGAGGIGRALAKALAERGARIALADISGDRAADAATDLTGGGRGYACDVTEDSSVADLVEAVIRDFGRIDALFANAGVAIGGKLTDTDIREVAWLMDVNVIGAVRTIQAFMPHLLRRAEAGGRPRIVLTGSENSIGLPSTGEMTAYTATKHAVLALADGLRRDLAGSGVGVSIFCPGLVNTRLWDSRSTRQARYGGAEAVVAERASLLETMVAQHGQDPAQTARLCLEGIDRDEFLIITDPHIRLFADARREQVYAALDRLDASLAD